MLLSVECHVGEADCDLLNGQCARDDDGLFLIDLSSRTNVYTNK